MREPNSEADYLAQLRREPRLVRSFADENPVVDLPRPIDPQPQPTVKLPDLSIPPRIRGGHVI